MPLLIDLASQPPASRVGAKAARLGWLMARGWQVPPGVVAPFEVSDALIHPDHGATRARIVDALETVIDPALEYVVRSSANVEDQGRESFAGQFASVSRLSGVDDVLAGMCEVAASGGSEQVREYARRVGVDPAGLRMAVIVQQMVTPSAAGVAFSRDPVTGADRVIVEAVAGHGDRLMGRGATPQRWTTDGTHHRAPDDPVLPTDVHNSIVATVRAVARDSGESVDLEWVWDGERVHLVQWRPAAGAQRPPTVWSSRMARDMLPGLIPPLVWSVNVPVISRTWTALIDEALGESGLDPDDLVRAFGYRAYFNTGAFGAVFQSLGMPADSLERMREGDGAALRPSTAALIRRAPRLGRFLATLGTWPRHARPQLLEVTRQRQQLEATDVAALSDDTLLDHVRRLQALLAIIGRLNIISPLLADTWAAAMRRSAARVGVNPGSVDPGQELPAVRKLSPAHVLADIDPADDDAWEDFLRRFGHLSDSPNDCSRPAWAEDGATVRRTLMNSGAQDPLHPALLGGDLHPTGGPDVRSQLLASAPPWRRPRLAHLWARCALLRLVRERVGYEYARVYALFRPAFLEAGARLVDRGALATTDDVFLLTLGELEQALHGELPDAAAVVAVRRAEMTQAAALHWPEVIVGDDPVPVLGRAGARVLQGVPTSQGRHTGPARVVVSLTGAGGIGPEDVLILPAADVTWTPLLLRAAAVVTETGGMLSHASIVARELGVPCVASVAGATQIPDGTPLAVDGAAGEVILLEQNDTGQVDERRTQP